MRNCHSCASKTVSNGDCSFNSVAYASTSANDYIIIEVNEAFITVPDAKNITIFNNTNVRYDYNYASLVHSLYEQHPGSNSSAFTHLENADCIRAYATDYLSDHSNLLLVTANQNASSPPTTNNAQNNTFNDNTSGGPSGCVPDPYPWICPASGCRNPCTSHWESQIGNASAWAPFGNTVGDSARECDHCLDTTAGQILRSSGRSTSLQD